MSSRRFREKDKRNRTFGMTVVSLQDQVVGDVRRALLVLLGLTGAGIADGVRQRGQPAAHARGCSREGNRNSQRLGR
jgi:hypothetical protein